MTACRVIPYAGNLPYLFTAFAPRDADMVFPLLDQLAMAGCRIWYDENKESQVSAVKLENCGAFLAFLSPNFSANHACRMQLNGSFAKSKDIVAVVLEEHALSPAMNLQLGRIPCFGQGEDWIKSIPGLTASCWGESGSVLPRENASSKEEKTVLDCGEQTCLDMGETTVLDNENPESWMLLRISDRTVRFPGNGRWILGQSEKECDICFSGSETISGRHAELMLVSSGARLRDAGSANGTFLRNRRLGQNEEANLHDPDIFRLGDETFALIFRDEARLSWRGCGAFLLDRKTMGLCILTEEEQVLGRNYPMDAGNMQEDKKISRRHLVITYDRGGYFLRDCSLNGTWINERRMRTSEQHRLSDGDHIRLGGTTLEFVEILF